MMKRAFDSVLVVSSALIFLASVFLPWASIHRECENRVTAGGFIVVAVVLILFAASSQAEAEFKLAKAAKTLCGTAIVINVLFIAFATVVC
jgi:hypothetical protein